MALARGTVPESWFRPTFKYCNHDIENSDVGSVPVKALDPNESRVNDDREPSVEGRVPLKLHDEPDNHWSCVGSEFGRVPVTFEPSSTTVLKPTTRPWYQNDCQCS